MDGLLEMLRAEHKDKHLICRSTTHANNVIVMNIRSESAEAGRGSTLGWLACSRWLYYFSVIKCEKQWVRLGGWGGRDASSSSVLSGT